jgi:hypothetical protein
LCYCAYLRECWNAEKQKKQETRMILNDNIYTKEI